MSDPQSMPTGAGSLVEVLGLRALDRAVSACGGAATTGDVVRHCPSEIVDALRGRCRQGLRAAVSKVLARLAARGAIKTWKGPEGGRRYYGYHDYAVCPTGQRAAVLPAFSSRRQRVLAITRDAVDDLRRAVRLYDVMTAAAHHPEGRDLTASQVGRDLQSLVRTGDLTVAGRVIGPLGNTLYLPTGYPAGTLLPHGPITDLEIVADEFRGAWEDAVQEAARIGCKPPPIVTGDIRARVASAHPGHALLADPRRLVNAVRQLAAGSTPRIREVTKRFGRVLWAPADVPDAALELRDAFASDSERVLAAALAASERLARLAGGTRAPVTVADVDREAEHDPHFKPRGTQPIARYLTDLAKADIDYGRSADGTRVRKRRVRPRLVRVGRVNGQAYYAVDLPADEFPVVRGYMAVRRLAAAWRDLNADEALVGAVACALPAVALGRARLLRGEIALIEAELAALLARPTGARGGRRSRSTEDGYSCVAVGPTRAEAEELAARVADTASAVDLFTSAATGAPRLAPVAGIVVHTSMVVWTADEVRSAVAPLYRLGSDGETRGHYIRLLYRAVRRVPNSNFVRRGEADGHAAAEELFDRTDALLQAAQRWGGSMARRRAIEAQHCLGPLRDARFVLADLGAGKERERMAALSCLAFLPPTESVVDAIVRAAETDPMPSVCQVATWALGFIRPDEHTDRVEAIGRSDRDTQVRNFTATAVARARADGAAAWWRL